MSVTAIVAGLPLGASLTAVIATVTLPAPASALPLPCAPVLPSASVQTIVTLAGGESELFQ